MRWTQVLPEAKEIRYASHSPVVLVLHAGGNDLCLLKRAELLTIMRADLEKIPIFFSDLVLVWSKIIPRVTWQGARDAAAIERARRTVNARISHFIQSWSGVDV